jgi:hypothetical protein
MNQPSLLFVFILLPGCMNNNSTTGFSINLPQQNSTFETIHAIPPPGGYDRMILEQGSFGEWLRALRLKKDNTVHLHDGSLKKDQSVHFAVLDITVGTKNLQQCADAVIRLRAEYLFAQKKYSEIKFYDNNNKPYTWQGSGDKTAFTRYLENVFGWCGTASLQKQLKVVNDLQQIKPGDVFIKGGFPGHAMIVVDVAQNETGQKVFMLAQSYMPAQDIHIVRNPANNNSAWYETTGVEQIITPEWTFSKGSLREW